MLQVLKDLKGLKIAAVDQQVGEVKDVLFDDLTFKLRYFVVKTGGWLSGREVLLSVESIKGAYPADSVLVSNLSKKQIEGSPPFEKDLPVSRQYEELLHTYYAWPPYWGTPIDAGYAASEVLPLSPRAEWHSLTEEEQIRLERMKRGDPHLQSANEVEGYKLHALDGDVGHVKDFLVDTENWKIKYFIVETGHWFASRKVVIDRAWLRTMEWAERDIIVALHRSDIEGAPLYDPEALGATYESDLTIYYKGLLDRWREKLSFDTHTRGGGDDSSAHPR